MRVSSLLFLLLIAVLLLSAPFLRAQEEESDYDDAAEVEQPTEEIVEDPQDSIIDNIISEEGDDLDKPLDIPAVEGTNDDDEDDSSDEKYEDLPGHGADADIIDIPLVGAGTVHKRGSNKNCKMTTRGVHLIKSFEGYRRNWYRDSVGVLTIGYGCTSSCRGVKYLTEPQASARLSSMLQNNYGTCVRAKVKRWLTTNQYNALTSFVYNLGCGVLTGNLLHELNAGQFSAAGRRMKLYNKAGGRTLAGLVRRRNAEVRLFDAHSPKCGQ
jgi:lysozyme